MSKTGSKIAANGVHLFTGSGLVLAIIAMYNYADKNNLHIACILLLLTTIIDAADGTLARKFRVKEFAPNVDGALLDNIIDFLTYAFIPAYFIMSTGIMDKMPAIIASSIIVLVSGYQFCQTNAKTDDHYFVGFPSYWNITFIFLYWLQLGSLISFLIIILLAVSVFIPVRYIYPSRTKPLMIPSLIITIPWGLVFLYTLIFEFSQPSKWFMYYSLFTIVYYYAASLYLNFKYKLMRQK